MIRNAVIFATLALLVACSAPASTGNKIPIPETLDTVDLSATRTASRSLTDQSAVLGDAYGARNFGAVYDAFPTGHQQASARANKQSLVKDRETFLQRQRQGEAKGGLQITFVGSTVALQENGRWTFVILDTVAQLKQLQRAYPDLRAVKWTGLRLERNG